MTRAYRVTSVTYVHEGGEKGEDFFCFSVSDGVGGTTEKTKLIIHVGKKSEDVGPSQNEESSSQEEDLLCGFEGFEGFDELAEALEVTTLPVNKGSCVVITTSDLQIFDLLSGQSHLQIKWTKLPEHGTMALEGKEISVGQILEKEDFDEAKVRYQHTDTEALQDQFCIEVSDAKGLMKTTESTFKIQVVEENKAPILLQHHALFVGRGATVLISEQVLKVVDLDTEADGLVFTLNYPPKYGTLLNGMMGVVDKLDTFTQAEIDGGLISYSHDGSEHPKDQMVFSLRDGSGGAIESIPLNVQVTEYSFALAHNHPLAVMEGQSAFITKENLQVVYTTDERAPLSFQVHQLPSQGTLFLKQSPLNQGDRFTQEDIDAGALRYQHN